MDWVVIVFAKYSARYLELVRCPRENIEVRWEVIVLNLERLFQIIDLEILEQGDSFSDTVLQLQVVDENNLLLETRLRFQGHTLQEFVVGLPESLVQDFVFLASILAYFVCARVYHRVVLELLHWGSFWGGLQK